ncbi:MAG: hypothetical protein HY208_05590 [Nitrospirae bacterium]|nr:hypothetical protein [Nitrospirota bacterium]
MRLLLFFLLFFSLRPAFGADQPALPPERTLTIHQIVGDPTNHKFYAITSNYGALTSSDGGRSWQTASRGLRSFTHHALAITSTEPPRLYLGAWGGGIYRSLDRGGHWTEMNEGLGNTAVDALVIDPRDPGATDTLYLAASTHFYRTAPDGRWTLYEDGLPPFPEDIKFKSLLLLPGPPKTVWYGNSQGLFSRPVDGARWSEEPRFHEVRVSALAYDAKNRRLWVGTLGKGLFVRDDQNPAWRPLAGPTGLWINAIVIDPSHPATVYLGTRGQGIYKSTDGGTAWAPANHGLEEMDIRSLALDSSNPALLLAGTTSQGFFRSTNGGDEWTQVPLLPALSMDQIIAMLGIDSTGPTGAAAKNAPAVPPAFAKCNRCHGWTDPALNQKHTYWRMPPNRRDWKPTVDRMAQRAGLTPAEQSAITEFLTAYSQHDAGSGP